MLMICGVVGQKCDCFLVWAVLRDEGDGAPLLQESITNAVTLSRKKQCFGREWLLIFQTRSLKGTAKAAN